MTAQKRLAHVCLITAAVLALGIGYGLFAMTTGYGIPCIYKLFTGLDCPSCGVSRMFLSLMRLDFAAAFGYNPVIFCMLPLLFLVGARWVYQYIRYGRTQPEKWMVYAGIAMLSALIIFGFVRNFV